MQTVLFLFRGPRRGADGFPALCGSSGKINENNSERILTVFHIVMRNSCDFLKSQLGSVGDDDIKAKE